MCTVLLHYARWWLWLAATMTSWSTHTKDTGTGSTQDSTDKQIQNFDFFALPHFPPFPLIYIYPLTIILSAVNAACLIRRIRGQGRFEVCRKRSLRKVGDWEGGASRTLKGGTR